ncbi:MAG: hemolysin family protein [Treponema sp.]|nr:hemolysin family protein [Treponema sp.]
MDSPASRYLGLAATFVVLLVLSAFFSVCETGFASLNRIKLRNMADGTAPDKADGRKAAGKRRSARARLALRMLESYDGLLSAVLIGNTLVNMALSAIATMLFIELFGAGGVTLATLATTFLVLLFAEISPKTLAKEAPELAAVSVAPVLRVFVLLFAPISRLAAVWKRLIAGLFRIGGNRAITEDELLTFVGEARQDGGINSGEERMIRQAIAFDEITAAEILTPRIDLAAVSLDDAPAEIDAVFAETGFSRLPAHRGNIDDITGVILLKDFHREVIGAGRRPEEIVKPVVFVTKTIKIAKLLRTLQEKKSHMAVLVDEFGGTLGIVTVEDIVEELVGEIWDEHDEVREPLRRNADGGFSVLGGTGFREMLQFLAETEGSADAPADGDEPEGETAEPVPATTVGNWVMEKSGGLPQVGDEFRWNGLTVKVSTVKQHRVMEVTVTSGRRLPRGNVAEAG